MFFKCWVVVAACLVIASGVSVDARLLAAAVIPHGDFAYDPSLIDCKVKVN
jgi:hypothetical protein